MDTKTLFTMALGLQAPWEVQDLQFNEADKRLDTYDVVINNITNQPVISNPVTLLVTPAPVPPSIINQPADATVTEGNSASFSVFAGGTMPLTYQWIRNATDMAGATSATYSIPAAALADSGAQFRCRVSNAAGTTTSNPGTLTVSPAPHAPSIASFTATPSTVTLGQAITFSWGVTGANSLSIDNGIGVVTGLTSKSVTPTTQGTFTYVLTATNAVGSTQASTQVTVTAAPTYTLTVNLGTGTTGTPSTTAAYTQGTVVNYTYSALAGYQGLQVTLDGTLLGTSGSVTMNSSHTLAVTAQVQSLSISASAGQNGTITPAGVTTVPYGGNLTYTIAPNTGFQVANVTVDGATVGAVTTYAFTNVVSSHTIAATFSAIPSNTLTVTLSSGVAGTPASTTTYTQGAVVNYSYTAQTGYQGLQVTLDGAPVAATGSVTMNRSHALMASAQVRTFTITATAGANGTITPAGATTVNYGGTQAFTITPNSGFQVAGILVDGASVGALTSYTFSNVTSSHTISATFSALPTFTLTVNLGTGTSGTPSSTASYPQGTTLGYFYYAQFGYRNLQVTVDGTAVPSSGTITMNGPHVISVSALVQTYTITASAGTGGTISPSGTTVVQNGGIQAYAIRANSVSGYVILDVKVNGVSVGAVDTYTFYALFSDSTIDATFGFPLTVKLTSTTGSPASTANYAPGTTINYTYAPDGASANLKVYVDNLVVPSSGTFTMSCVNLFL